MKWYIGQEIVCIKAYEKAGLKVGKTYTIHGLMISQCKCKHVEIDVGVTNYGYGRCVTCKYTQKKPTHIWWFNESIFAPIDFDISELTDILEKPKELIKK